jgi:hypothetical protein
MPPKNYKNFEKRNPGLLKSKPLVKPAKIGRNDRCPCGNGKKFKNCCLQFNITSDDRYNSQKLHRL